jgi:alkylation response protein AidB-like acyl-CoA dehydrogenase
VHIYLTHLPIPATSSPTQEQLQKAQSDKRDLQEALDQVRAQIAANQAGIVTAATEVSVQHLHVCCALC